MTATNGTAVDIEPLSDRDVRALTECTRFQSRRGFSDRLDRVIAIGCPDFPLFQSRAGFSLRRDFPTHLSPSRPRYCFNPVLGFLSVATSSRNSDGD